MSNTAANIPEDAVALDREDWMQIMEDLLEIGPYIHASIEEIATKHPETMHMISAMDPETFEADLRAACAAIAYVAEFAADKCLFVPIKEE